MLPSVDVADFAVVVAAVVVVAEVMFAVVVLIVVVVVVVVVVLLLVVVVVRGVAGRVAAALESGAEAAHSHHATHKVNK